MVKTEFFNILVKFRNGECTKIEEGFLLAYYSLFEIREGGIENLNDDEIDLLKRSIKKEIDQLIAQHPNNDLKAGG